MSNKPSYYAIIPANVRYDSRLKASEKLLYGEITALCNKEGYCWANSNYFAKLYDVARETVSRWISDLQKFGYIDVKINASDGNTRQIRLKNDQNIVSDNHNLVTKNTQPCDEKVTTPCDEKVTYNNTSTNTTYNKDNICRDRSRRTSSLFKKEAEEVLSFLNEKTGRSYRMVDTNLTLIIERLKSGVTIQDCRCVIAKKRRDWINDDKMKAYLRPATLFNKTKFEQYLGELYHED